MANEITGQLQLQCVNGSYASGQVSNAIAVTQNAQGANSGVMVVAASGTLLTVGTVTTVGMLYMRNLDPTNFVTFGSTVGYEFKLKAGESFLGRVTPGQVPTLKADTASVKVQILLLQD